MKQLLLVSVAAACLVAAGQNSHGTTGYVNRPMMAGQNVFGNPLNDVFGGNHLSSIVPSPPLGTQVFLWNPVTASFGSPSIFQAGSWTSDFVLAPGTGAKLVTPEAFINTFVGQILQPDGSPYSDGQPILPPPAFSGPDGVYLLSSKFPACLGAGSQFGSVFDYVVGRAPGEGEQFIWLSESTQAYHTTTFTGGAWDNGVPSLSIAQSACFNLGPVVIPEPATASLLALALGGLCLLRRRPA